MYTLKIFIIILYRVLHCILKIPKDNIIAVVTNPFL